jgi:hypothetical protein
VTVPRPGVSGSIVAGRGSRLHLQLSLPATSPVPCHGIPPGGSDLGPAVRGPSAPPRAPSPRTSSPPRPRFLRGQFITCRCMQRLLRHGNVGRSSRIQGTYAPAAP